MELIWLGRYRQFVEQMIKFGNAYAQNYNVEHDCGAGVSFSAAQIQTIEYILENEEKNQNMAEIAARLGITASAFSKNVKKMVQKGLLEKYHVSNNRKDVIVRVSAAGRGAYEQYTSFALQKGMKAMFDALEQVPEETLCQVAEALGIAAGFNREAVGEPVLIKIEE